MNLQPDLILAVAGGVALLSPIVLRPILAHVGVMDVPNARSSHTAVTLRGGGTAPLLAFVIAGLAALLSRESFQRDGSYITIIIVSATITGTLGLVEDTRGLKVFVRASFQLFVGASLTATLCLVCGISWVWIPLGAVGFAAYVNFANFMDGVNGISSLHGLTSGGTYAAIGIITDLPWLTFIGILIAVTFITFLPWNLLGQRMFLGDVGSYLLGAAIAAAAMTALAAGLNVIAVLAPLAIYLADTIATLARRFARGEAVFQPHRSHTYQKLTSTGLTHVSVAGIVSIFSLGTGAVGVLLMAGWTTPVTAVIIICILITTYLSLPRIRHHVSPPPLEAPLVPSPLPLDVSERPTWRPQRWAVMGSTGFIGSALTEHLRLNGADVIPIPSPRLRLDPATSDAANVARLAVFDPSKPELAKALIGVDVVINAAGLATPDASDTNDLYGANALLPAVIASAAATAGVGRVIHLSSAAVQGHRKVLDATTNVAPFSPYSRSKALGEIAFSIVANSPLPGQSSSDFIIVRATSVQGRGRPTTNRLLRVARSPMSSVAGDGGLPSVVSSLSGLVHFTEAIGAHKGHLPSIVLQPWEGLSTLDVLESASGRTPIKLPVQFCNAALAFGRFAGRFVPAIAGIVRRLELMWFGQAQEQAPVGTPGLLGSNVREILADRADI